MRGGIRYILVVLLISIAITPVYGKDYQSSFGFTLNIPEHWLVLTCKEFKENPNLIDFDNKSFKNIDKNLLKKVESAIKSGEFEMYFNQKTSDGNFADNITVRTGTGKIPESNTQLREVCDSASKQLSSYVGRKIKIYQCKLVDINHLKSLFLECDGAFEETRTIQYIIQKSPGVKITFTLACKNGVLDTIRKEFDRIVLSIKM
jgi:hypothetical protein